MYYAKRVNPYTNELLTIASYSRSPVFNQKDIEERGWSIIQKEEYEILKKEKRANKNIVTEPEDTNKNTPTSSNHFVEIITPREEDIVYDEL